MRVEGWRKEDTVEQRYERWVQRGEECWGWTGSLTWDGYGRFMHRRRAYLAHVFSYTRHVGKIPEGLSVLHHCDNPPCSRPDHLFVGTQAINLQDMDLKSRRAKVRRDWKLSDAQVDEIRALQGLTQAAIAGLYSVHPSVVSRIRNNRRRMHRH